MRVQWIWCRLIILNTLNYVVINLYLLWGAKSLACTRIKICVTTFELNIFSFKVLLYIKWRTIREGATSLPENLLILDTFSTGEVNLPKDIYGFLEDKRLFFCSTRTSATNLHYELKDDKIWLRLFNWF